MKINDSNEVIVIGHKNPDTDSICSTIAYANLKNQMNDGKRYVACRAGDVSLESAYVLKRFGAEAPKFVSSVATQVGDLEIDEIVPITEETSMRAAWKAMREENAKSQPIVRKNGEIAGLITLNDIAKGNMDNLDPEILAVSKTPLKNVLDILHGNVLTGNADAVIESGKILVGAGDAGLIKAKAEEGSILIVSNREDAQLAAIEGGCAILIVCLSGNVSDAVLEEAKKRSVTVISTEFDTYACARRIAESAPVRAFMTGEEDLVLFDTEDRVDDVRTVMQSSRHIAFPVSGKDGRYIGVIDRSSLLTETGKKMILVDHNEKTQCVDGFEEAQILEIIDHHKIGNIETKNPIQFVNKPVGCTATIIYGMYQENQIAIDPKTAGLMLSAILSDTLDFRSPTCTDKDVKAAETLAKIAGVDPHQHALEMFSAGESLEGRTAEDVFYGDFKIFTKGDIRFGVGQGSYMSPDNLQQAVELVKPYMESTLAKDNTDMCFFMATSIADQSSRVIYAGEKAEEVLESAFDAEKKPGEDGILLSGVVSRKKQMIPPLMQAID